jgi:hypothetical protein
MHNQRDSQEKTPGSVKKDRCEKVNALMTRLWDIRVKKEQIDVRGVPETIE